LYLYSTISTYVSWLVWELGLLGLSFFTLYEMGLYYSKVAGNVFPEALLALTIVFGTSILYPIIALSSRCDLPPLIGCLLLPLTKGSKKGKSFLGRVFYGISLLLQYAIGLFLLIGSYLHITGWPDFLNCLPFIPFSRVAPAITLIVLFARRTKGRYQLLFFYSLLVLINMIIVEIPGIASVKKKSDSHLTFAFVNYPIYGVVFFYHLVAFITSCCRGEFGYFWFWILPTQLLIFLPSLLIMPLLLTLVDATFEKLLAPAYIVILLAAVTSIAAKIMDIYSGKANGSKLINKYLRYHIAVFTDSEFDDMEGFHDIGGSLWAITGKFAMYSGIVLVYVIFLPFILAFKCLKAVIKHY